MLEHLGSRWFLDTIIFATVWKKKIRPAPGVQRCAFKLFLFLSLSIFWHFLCISPNMCSLIPICLSSAICNRYKIFRLQAWAGNTLYFAQVHFKHCALSLLQTVLKGSSWRPVHTATITLACKPTTFPVRAVLFLTVLYWLPFCLPNQWVSSSGLFSSALVLSLLSSVGIEWDNTL